MDFWPACGFHLLRRNARGWLQVTPQYLQLLLQRPELALVPESCKAEKKLHQDLLDSPSKPVTATALARIQDEDARHNYRTFLAFRDGLLASDSLEQYYQDLFQQGPITIAPVFIDLLTQLILRNLLDGLDDAQVLRAAEMLFRSQRISLQNGRVLAADREVVDMHSQTGGLGELGRLLLQSKANLRSAELEVLGTDNAAKYWATSERHHFLLDLTHEFTQELSHGLSLRLAHARSGLKSLAQVLEKWIAHFHGVQVSIRPESRIDDPNWRWHVGLDTDSSALLNDLYDNTVVEPARMQRLISLFRLDFTSPARVRADVAGKPVYLGLCMGADDTLKLKPQNLLLNLPLAPHESTP